MTSVGAGLRFVSLGEDGPRLAYREAGTGDPAIVLVHGMACDHTHLLPQLGGDLAGEGAHVGVLDATRPVGFDAELGDHPART